MNHTIFKFNQSCSVRAPWFNPRGSVVCTLKMDVVILLYSLVNKPVSQREWRAPVIFKLLSHHNFMYIDHITYHIQYGIVGTIQCLSLSLTEVADISSTSANLKKNAQRRIFFKKINVLIEVNLEFY